MEWPVLADADADVFGGFCDEPSAVYRSLSGPVKISLTGASPYRAISYARVESVIKFTPHALVTMRRGG